MEKTLWQLIQSLETTAAAYDECRQTERGCGYREAARQVKQWAREKAKEWGRRNRAGRPVVLAYECIGDLGVPEEKP